MIASKAIFKHFSFTGKGDSIVEEEQPSVLPSSWTQAL